MEIIYLHWAQNNLRTSFLNYTACFIGEGMGTGVFVYSDVYMMLTNQTTPGHMWRELLAGRER